MSPLQESLLKVDKLEIQYNYTDEIANFPSNMLLKSDVITLLEELELELTR